MSPAIPLEPVCCERLPRGYGGLFHGVFAAIVSDVVDPDDQGRVRVRLPWSPDPSGQRYEAWARLATMMAGDKRGTWFIPDVGDEVLVAFESGDPRRPYVLGALWNGKDAPPESMDSGGKNDIKTICSRNGVIVTFDDTGGRESLTLKTPGGQEIVLKDGPGVIEARDSNGNSVEMKAGGITVTASAKVDVSASVLEISAGAVTVNAGLSKFSGVVQADTVISNSVVSASYTPGAGNIW